MNQERPSLAGRYVLLVASMALWGGTWIAGRVLGESLHPMSSAFLRFLSASIFLALMTRRAEGRLPRLALRDLPHALFLGLTGVFAYSHFFFTGLKFVPAGRAALIVACIPVCIAVCSAFLFRERFGPLRVVGTLLSLCGVAVVIADGNPLALLQGGMSRGDLLILGCVASWTAYSLGGKAAMKRISPLSAVTWSCILGTLMLLGPAVHAGLGADIQHARPVDWTCVFFLGVLATGLAYFWYYEAIRVIGAARSGIFINLVPVFAIVFGFLLLGEPVHLSLIFGGGMVIAGVWLTNR